MRNFEVHVDVDGDELRHDVQVASDEPKVWKIITGLIAMYYKAADSVTITRVREFQYACCPTCDGTGTIPPCCTGMPKEIECACGGIDTICDDCEEGRYRTYPGEINAADIEVKEITSTDIARIGVKEITSTDIACIDFRE